MDPMDAIKATYFQECDELLASLEEGLLALQTGDGDNDTINAVFRAVHSIKGGAGAFGFEDMVEFAHVFETSLDEMRSGRLDPDPHVLKVMLRASDVLADHVQAAKGEGVVDAVRAQAMSEELEALTAPPVAAVNAAPVAAELEKDEWGFAPLKVEFDMEPEAPAPWMLTMRPTSAMYAKGHDAALFLRELARLGEIKATLDVSLLPDLLTLDAEAAYCGWTVELAAEIAEQAILDVFDFVGDDCAIKLRRAGSELELPFVPEAPPAPVVAVSAPVETIEALPVAQEASSAAKAEAKADNKSTAPTSATIRVDLERVDRLIDLVGELVINQAMLAQRVMESEQPPSSTVTLGLDELEQLTRQIQDSVMAIRAQPVKSVFQRMPRLVREIAASTGKQVRLVMEGEGTEVDKTVIERLSDPITHMLRNAIDHGLETPAERIGAGKQGEGVVRLSALHRSGRIVIEVSDDGKGINRPRVREIAIKKGLISPEANLSDDEIDNLIFLPGFSTASSVSNISGRGVGMDVVKRSIQALGGRIAITSQPGKGSKFSLSLPLTLAVLDGMVISASDQTLVAPLTAIIETLRPKPEDVRALGPTGAVLLVRGEHVPLIDVGVALGIRTKPVDPANGVVLLVESEGISRAALVADEIQGQRQVVIKSLEANFQRVVGIAAATILGDGRVALILDIEAMLERRLNERVIPLARAS
ncbi:chemotaxis protein CheA [Candidatus Viadribacter manganicus]|uniref:Chemotaxis protein CheA n=1 Tax=Candidatus Viadribacter manganicus TaxID=1759059 RepID=A0A1B1AJN3_9PROT|nr:chemotaxis protein CheA [Candidatus Viadribacter manganicus]ANP46765.1 chemotaxis protein CheA [Candidatus Viadribacter manganicus]